MKRTASAESKFRAACLSVSLILLFIANAVCLSAGLTYELRRTNEPWSVHIVRIPAREYRIVAERARGKGLGRETVSSMARRRNAVLAVNGGFFQMGGKFDGEPLGILKIADDWFSDSTLPRGAIGWSEEGGKVLVDRVAMSWTAQIGQLVLPLNGINRVRGATDVILYTSGFNESTLAGGGGIEILVERAEVQAVVTSGNAPIPPAGLVVSVGSRVTGYGPEDFPKGTAVSLEHRFRSAEGAELAEWEPMDHIVGGTPLLVQQGVAVSDFSPERVKEGFGSERHPRTAVGITADGSWVLVVVDGRRPGYSVGMTLQELAALMLELGCRDALNLDGGGSSTIYLYGQVVNEPSDFTGERPVSDALLVLRR